MNAEKGLGSSAVATLLRRRGNRRATIYFHSFGGGGVLLNGPAGATSQTYLSEAAVGVFIGWAAVGAVAAAGLLLLVQERRGVRQGILQGLR